MDLPLKTLDCICTRSESFVGDVIRFFTKGRVKGATNVANHCGDDTTITSSNNLIDEMILNGLS